MKQDPYFKFVAAVVLGGVVLAVSSIGRTPEPTAEPAPVAVSAPVPVLTSPAPLAQTAPAIKTDRTDEARPRPHKHRKRFS